MNNCRSNRTEWQWERTSKLPIQACGNRSKIKRKLYILIGPIILWQYSEFAMCFLPRRITFSNRTNNESYCDSIPKTTFLYCFHRSTTFGRAQRLQLPIHFRPSGFVETVFLSNWLSIRPQRFALSPTTTSPLPGSSWRMNFSEQVQDWLWEILVMFHTNTHVIAESLKYCMNVLIRISTVLQCSRHYQLNCLMRNTHVSIKWRWLWRVVCAECGPSLLTDSEGTVTSPGHPGSFPGYINCTWTIQVADSDTITLFFDSFSMGDLPYYAGSDCLFWNDGAMVSVYDGDTDNGTLIGRWVSAVSYTHLTLPTKVNV